MYAVNTSKLDIEVKITYAQLIKNSTRKGMEFLGMGHGEEVTNKETSVIADFRAILLKYKNGQNEPGCHFAKLPLFQ